MFERKQLLLFLLFISLTKSQTIPTRSSTLSTFSTNRNAKIASKKIVNVSSPSTLTPGTEILVLPSEDTTADEIKNEVFVNDLLEKVKEDDTDDDPEDHRSPNYELNWDFIDKDTIRVTFDLFSVPTSLIGNNQIAVNEKPKSNLLATVVTMPSRAVKSITVLQYYVFIIRPYHKNREIVQKVEKLTLKNSTSRKYSHFSNALRLTALNHDEKYSVCICYYQKNGSIRVPDLVLCQDIINDYSKFGHLKADPKHGLVFITTQYSIIIALLVVLQSVFTMRKRRVAEFIGQMVANKAHSIRSTLSAVSLVRQSFSSLDAAAEQQQQHATNDHAIHHRESTVEVEKGIKKRIASSPEIIISELSVPVPSTGALSDETEPFLKQIPSRNHVHFLLGPGEGSEEEEDHDHHDTDTHTQSTSTSQREPYNDQSDSFLCMAHILDTNKPWSKHGHQTSPV